MSYEFTQSIQTIGEFLASSTGVFLLTHVAKKVQSIPIFTGETTKIRAFAGVLSALSVVIISAADQNLGSESTGGLILAVLGFGSTWFSSHAMHKAFTAKE